MSPELFHGKNVIVQGITGAQGTFHTRRMIDYGTNIVAGTSPNKAGTTLDAIPVYKTIKDIQKDTTVDSSVIFVPAPFAKAAILEAIEASIPLIVCITETIPVHDMLVVKKALKNSRSTLIGPNCPGVLVPGEQLLGIIPASLSAPGSVGVVSRSGTLTYEAMDLLTSRGIGQRAIVGIGGDMVKGSSFIDTLAAFEADNAIDTIVMIGEIGGTDEIDAADYIEASVKKPVYAYVAGHSAPTGIQMGHAGAILGTNSLETAQAKTEYLEKKGVITASSITNLIDILNTRYTKK